MGTTQSPGALSNAVGQQAGAIKGINIGSDLNNIGNVQGQLQNFQTPGALQGAAFGGLQGMINTGNPADVSGITQAAQNTAGRTFQDLMGQTNEQFGALNLGSSSAREAQLGRQAQNLAQGVGDTGLIAGVGAQENAANRQLGAMGQFGGLRGQDLGALGSAGQMALGRGGLNLEGQLGQVGAGQNFINPLMGTFGQGMQTPGIGTQPAAGMPGGALPSMGGFRDMASSSSTSGGGSNSYRMGNSPYSMRAQTGGMVPSFASGGNVSSRLAGNERVDQQDFMSNLLFGVNFNKPQHPAAIQQMYSQPRGYQPSEADLDRQRFLSNQGGFRPTSGRFSSKAQTDPFAGISGRDWRYASDPTMMHMPGADDAIMKVNRSFGPDLVAQMMMQKGKNFSDALSAASGAGAGAQSNILSTMAAPQSQYGSRSPGQLGFADGGFVGGPAVPPDQVPALLQGGEGVIPVKLMSKLKKSNSKDPLIKNLKTLMFEDKKKAESRKKAKGVEVKKTSKVGAVPKMQAGGLPMDQINERIRSMREQYGATPDMPLTFTEHGPTTSADQTPGVSQLGSAPMTDDERLQKRRADAERRASLIRSAMVTETQGSMESLAPMLVEAQNEVNTIGEEQVNVANATAEQQRAQAFQTQANAQMAGNEGLGDLRAAQTAEIERQGSPEGQANALVSSLAEAQARTGASPDVDVLKQTVDNLFGLSELKPAPGGFTGPPEPPEPGMIENIFQAGGGLLEYIANNMQPAYAEKMLVSVKKWQQENPQASVAEFKQEFPVMSYFIEHHPAFGSPTFQKPRTPQTQAPEGFSLPSAGVR